MTVNSNDLCYQHIDRCYRNFCQTSQDVFLAFSLVPYATRRQAPADQSQSHAFPRNPVETRREDHWGPLSNRIAMSAGVMPVR